MLRLRILSTLLGAPIVLLLIYLDLGLWPVGSMVFVLSCVALIEFYRPWPAKNIFPALALGVFFGCLFSILVVIGRSDFYPRLLVISFISIALWQMFSDRKTRLAVDTGVTLLGIIYAGMFPSYLILIRGLDNGRNLLFAVVFGVWACDIAAYCIGKTIGKHKLAPEISPNKTKEGAIGGIVASTAVITIFSALTALPILKMAILGVVIGVLAQAGDLFASMLKREAGIKDYGKSIPGHGGVLDRFDGLFFVAPIIFYLLYLY